VAQNLSVVSVAIPRPIDTLYTYRVPEGGAASCVFGNWVKVPFGKAQTVGYIASLPRDYDEKFDQVAASALKSITEFGDVERVPTDTLFKLAKWASTYYLAPLGEALSTLYPKSVHTLSVALRSKAPRKKKAAPRVLQSQKTLSGFNSEQQSICNHFHELRSHSLVRALIEGVTGSGKTEVYLACASQILAENKGFIFLLPEIALTAQMRDRVEQALGEPVILWHSAVTPSKRASEYDDLRSGKVRIVLGARSAIFAPVKNLGLIVVDEEHDGSYKQEERFRYHARDLAYVRADFEKAHLILGSATPSLETLERVLLKKIAHFKLTQKFHVVEEPEIFFEDLTTAEMPDNIQSHLTVTAVEMLQATIQKGEQALLYLNRKGYSPILMCFDCKHIHSCQKCSSRLTFYDRKQRLVCHLCGYQEKPKPACPSCLGLEVYPVGAGTEAVEEDLKILMPEARVLRLDRSVVTSASRLEKIINEFKEGKADILVGTQMIAKGHDFSRVSLVVVLLADDLFYAPDFRAPERALQTLLQVSGRAGRAGNRAKILIQTYQPEHPVLQVLGGGKLKKDFLESERLLRKELNFPPFCRVIRLRIESTQQNLKQAERIAEQLKMETQALQPGETVQVLGPAIPSHERIDGVYRVDIHLRGQSVSGLRHIAKTAIGICQNARISLVVDVDPLSLG